MPKTFEKASKEQISVINDTLVKIASRFTSVLAEIQSAGMPGAYIEWSRKHYDALQMMVESSSAAVRMVESQVVAFRSKVPSVYERQAVKVARAAELKRKQAVSKAGTPKTASTAGRPTKKAK